MQRRTAVRLIALSTGALLIPGCSNSPKKTSISLDQLKINGDDESLLTAVTDTIIPSTVSPGAKELKLAQFVMKMVDDCSSEEEQRIFEKGLSSLDGYAQKVGGDNFVSLPVAEREKVLLSIEKEMGEKNDADAPQPLHRFYQITKSFAVRGYLNSEYVMTNLTHYQMVPGRFDGCVEVTNPQDYKTIFG